LTVDREGVVVVLPTGVHERHAAKLIREKQVWLERTLERFERSRSAVALRDLGDGGSVPYLDGVLDLKVVQRPGTRGSVSLAKSGECLTVRNAEVSRDSVVALLESWYRRQAHSEIGDRLDAVVARNGTTYRSLSIRGQRTRWGSCSSKGGMSFNWRLLMAPEHVLDYVVEHEAAHLEVMDHSPRFWNLIDQRVPNWRSQRDWLREHGDTLFL